MLRSGDWIDPMEPVDLTGLADRYRRRRRIRIWAGALTTAVVIAGASVTAGYVLSDREAPQPQLDSGDQPIPWVDTKPAAQPPPTACPPGKLTISLGRAGLWHGQARQTVEIRNDSGAACTLPTTISATAVTGQGTTTPADASGLPPQPVALIPGQMASLYIDSPGCGRPAQKADTVTVRIADGSPVALTGARVYVECGNPIIRELYVEPIEPATQSIAVSAKISAPDRVPAGTTLRFTVTLTNDSDSPITFDGCPAYLMGLKPTEAGGTYRLNCSVSPTLDPQQSRTYEMILEVPTSADGVGQLGWSLIGYEVGDSVQVTLQ